MNNLTLSNKYFILLKCLSIIGSSCHKENIHIPSVEEKTPLSLSTDLEEDESTDASNFAFKDKSSEIEGAEYCPYPDYSIVLKEVKREYQHLANEKCEDIYICKVCCLDGFVTYALFRIQPNQNCLDAETE